MRILLYKIQHKSIYVVCWRKRAGNVHAMFVWEKLTVKLIPQNPINKFIIRKLSPLAVVDFRFISTFLHA